jgi:hypothetical protein
VFPAGTWTFLADDRLRRDVRPRNFEDPSSTSRIDNLLDLALRYQPGGRTISGTLKYTNSLGVYEDTNADNRMNHTVALRGDWQWLPYTRYFAEASLGFFGGVGDSGGLPKESSMPIRGLVGVATALTEPLTLKAHVGWGYSGYSAGEGYNGRSSASSSATPTRRPGASSSSTTGTAKTRSTRTTTAITSSPRRWTSSSSRSCS